MSGENPALIVRVVANIEDLKKGLLEGKAVIEATTTDIQQLGGSLAGTSVSADALETALVTAADVAQQAFQPVPGIFAQLRAGLNDVAEGAGLTFTGLGLITSAGLAIGVGYEAWQITRAVMEFFQLDEAVSKAWVSLLGFGDAAAEAAAAKADVLAKASKTAGREITDMAEAMAINAKAVKDWDDALQRARGAGDSAIQIEKWNQELDKIVKAGVLKSLQADIESHNFSVKELSERYRILPEAIAFFTRELRADADVAKAWAKDQTDAAKAAADAHKAAVAVELAELKIMDAFRHEAHVRQVEIIRVQTDEQTKAAGVVNAAVTAEFDAQVKLNAEWGLNASGALTLQHTALETLNRAMDALHAKKVEGISQAQQEQVLMDAYTRELYDVAVATESSAGRQVAAIRGVTQSWGEAIDAAARAAGVTVVGNRPGEGPGINGAPPSGGFSLGGFSLGPTTFAPSVLSSHAAGGPVNEGPAYLHDDEYVVPEGGALVMRSAGGGGTTINLTMHVNGTGADVARVAIDVLTKTMKQGRQYPSA